MNVLSSGYSNTEWKTDYFSLLEHAFQMQGYLCFNEYNLIIYTLIVNIMWATDSAVSS